MTPYATAAELASWSDFYGVPVPSSHAERLLDLATRDVQRHLGFEWDPALLDPDQAHALSHATCIQAIFRAEQGPELNLGTDDGIASAGPLSFSLRPVARFSVEAAEMLSGLGLYARSGTVTTPPDAAA